MTDTACYTGSVNRLVYLQLFTEFAPVVTFFVAARFVNFFEATAILIAMTLFVTVLGILTARRLPFIPLFSSILVLVSGGITLIYRAPDALIVADSIYYLLMAGSVGGAMLRGHLLLKRIFETAFAISDAGWRILSWRWLMIFVLAGVANEIARYTLTPEMWINFKFFKTIALTVFALYQFTLAKHYRIVAESNRWGIRTVPLTATVKTDTSHHPQ